MKLKAINFIWVSRMSIADELFGLIISYLSGTFTGDWLDVWQPLNLLYAMPVMLQLLNILYQPVQDLLHDILRYYCPFTKSPCAFNTHSYFCWPQLRNSSTWLILSKMVSEKEQISERAGSDLAWSELSDLVRGPFPTWKVWAPRWFEEPSSLFRSC